MLREEPVRDDFMKISHKSLNGREKSQKKTLIEANETKITRTKKNIEGL